MSPLLNLLSFYYLCDQAAAQQVLSASDVADCMANYDRIKHEFINQAPAPMGSAERAAQNRLGYISFKSWEAANPDLVQEFRAKAQANLMRITKTNSPAIAGLANPNISE